ncbi:discoidin domain-containing protein [Dactylosporangium matsuzakiense]|uniref:discoidin domain-containing protein n=1 Tax=Dactylosporangium matsuzakiense TaxID=53360 RepID=UPI0021C3F8CB|nr:discoidin domain-containing protein [Dactylosporangium matsuzakiense]UWZ47258.1 discoidin domain-containing protein [Dactylosporangium matsuzakiense]
MSRRLVTRRVLAAFAVAALVAVTAQTLPAEAAGGPNLAGGRSATSSSTNGQNGIGNINDGNQASYWESANNAWPQWAQIDLGSAKPIDQIKLKLPNDTAWATRTQTLSVTGSADGTSFATIVSSGGYTFNPASQNTVTISFNATTTRYVRLNFTANTGWPAAQVSEFEIYGVATTGGNLAAGRTFTASSQNAQYAPGNGGDANQDSYWESSGAFPQWLQVDLGSAVPVSSVVLKLPAAWGARTETLSVQGSTTGSTFSDIVASNGYSFAPGAANTVTIPFTQTTTRYIRVNITANTGWTAAQLSELEVYGPTTGDTQAPTAPGSLAYTSPGSGLIKLTWTASTDNSGTIAGYDVYANGTLRTSVAGNVLTYTDSQPDTATVAYYVKARDAAGNQSPNSNTVTRTGTNPDTQAPTAPGSLAYTQPAAGQIKLTWTASSDNSGSIAGYDVYVDNSLRGSVAGNVLTYTDSQPDTATVSYYVKARDAAGNASAASNTVTRTGTGTPTGTNVALGKTIEASGSVFTFVPANANDNSVTTYWEGAAGYPATLTVKLGANHDISKLTLKLDPSSAWASRTQNVQVLGREQSASAFTQLVGAANYTWNPASGNSVDIPVSARVADVRLQFNSNTGAPSGQLAEFQVFGTPAPNPDLQVTAVSQSPAAPVETDSVSLTATVRNSGSAASTATNVNFYLGTAQGTILAGTANVTALAAGAQGTFTANIGPRTAGTYTVSAKVDEGNSVVETNEANNAFTSGSNLVVAPVQSSDLVASPVAWSPSNPSAGNTVTFTVVIKNQGTQASGSGAHGVTLTLLDSTGATVKTLTGSYSGTLAAGASSPVITLGTWTAVNGKYTAHTVLAADTNELSVKQANNTSDNPLFVGRGANMPYDMYEAEDGTVGGGASVVGPNRTIGDLAGEASGRKAVTLNGTGQSVQWTTRQNTNTVVVRFSIPDGTTSSINVYVNGSFAKAIPLTSKYAWLYGNEASPTNSPGTGPRHIYDEASIMLDSTVNAGSTIKLQKDAANSGNIAVDFINLEQVAPIANPNPATFITPAGFTQQDVQNAFNTASQSTTAVGVYLPAGTYVTNQKFQVNGKALQVVGAGPWYTKFTTPQDQQNTDAGFAVQTSANGSTFKNLSFFGNYVERIDGPGKVWGELKDNQNLTIDNVWVEHTVCMYWGVHNSGINISNSRIRDTFADGINFTNDTTNTHLNNIDARSTGDDSFALFSAIDSGGSVGNHDNLWENLSATLTWRAAGFAVYGGYSNTFRNMYIADMLCYSGITISSLDFGYPFVGFGTQPTTIQNVSLVRDGGHFWGQQAFGAIWAFSASKEFRGIRVSDVDIVDPTYQGIMFQTKYKDPNTPEYVFTDTIFTNINISGARRSGDAFDAKSGIGIWANELPEANQGPARGAVTFNHLTFSNNAENIRNTTPLVITVNP